METQIAAAEELSPAQSAIRELRKVRASEQKEEETEPTPAAPEPEQPVVEAPEAPAPVVEEPKPAEEPAPETIQTAEKLSRSWANLTKREGSLVLRERQATERESNMKKLEESYKEGITALQELKSDPVAFMNKHAGDGWYEKATQRFFSNSSGQLSAEDKIALLEKRLAEESGSRDKYINDAIQKWATEQEKARSERELTERYMRDADELIAKDDQFELTRNHPNGAMYVRNLINEYFDKFGKVLTQQEAAGMIEAELEKEFEQLANTKKAKAKLGAVAAPQKATTAEKSAPQLSKTTRPPEDAPTTLTSELSGMPTAWERGARNEVKAAAETLRRLRQQRNEA